MRPRPLAIIAFPVSVVPLYVGRSSEGFEF